MTEEKQSKNWFKRHKVITATGIIFALLLITGAVNDDSTGKSSQTAESHKTSQSKTYRFNERADKQSTDVELALAESGQVDGVKLTVNSASYRTALNDFDNAATGSTYVVVSVTLENVSDRTKSYNPFDFRVQTEGGQVLDTVISSIPTLRAGDLVTSGKVTGDVVFQVPAENGHQYLIWKPNGVKSDRAIVQIK